MRTSRWVAVACLAPFLLTLMLAGPAAAQIKPKILILFDTSGSMLQNSSGAWQWGDGSSLCGGQGQQSRVYQLKDALFDTLQGMGAQEVDFALATFPMFMDPTRTPYCALGANTPCLVDANCTRPGDTCVSFTCVSPCQSQPSCSGHYYTAAGTLSELPAYKLCANKVNDCRYGCKISTHNATTQTNGNCGAAANPCAAWYPQLSEVLHVPFAGTAPEKVMIFFDHNEDTNTTAPLANPEVRAGNGWWTPLGKSLFYAHGYFHKDVVPSIPAYEKPCTNLAVAFFTDGGETCNDAPSDPYYPVTWAGNLYNNLQVKTHTVAIDTPTSANQLLNAIAQAGQGSYTNVQGNTAALKQAFLDIILKSLPPTESCNGLDDDCDTQIDEDFPLKGTPCDNGLLGVCFKTGSYVCKADGSGVECSAPSPSGTPELCNGLDDDCDGEIDEIPGCIPPLCQPEICNNKDDDCDNEVDEGIPSSYCGKDMGECKPGQTKCINGAIVCDGGTGPTTEICNGLDDDCDGARDGLTESCYSFSTGCTYQASVGWLCVGFCKPGIKTCNAKQVGGAWIGEWTTCQGDVGPTKEICNGLDDDCDGTVDNNAECPEGSQCINGACTGPCGTGEFQCPKGQICQDGWCVADPCDPAECPEGWVCKGGKCIDPCVNAVCGKYEVCIKGACVDTSCYNPANACPEGETCVQGKCEAAPCFNKECGTNEFCKDGVCVQICDTLTCPAGQLCKVVDEGGKPVAKCVEDACAGQQCGEGYVCVDGLCQLDPCTNEHCPQGEVCIVEAEGGKPVAKCVTDPCETVECPTGFTCDRGNCLSASVTSTRDLLATGAGGVACSLAGPEQEVPAWPAFLLFILTLLILSRPVTPSRRD